MTKKFFTLLLAVAASVGTMFAWDYERVQIGDLYYNLDATNHTAEVTSQNSDYPYWSTSITTANIPASVKYHSVKYSVTSIGDMAFAGCTGLTSVEIPNSVTSIGDGAFYSCSGLTSVTIPNSVTSIGDEAFAGCDGLTSITIPNSVTSIGNYAFSWCTSLTSVHISDIAAWCAISFGDYYANPLFYAHNLYLNGELVTDLVIPNSVTSIGDMAFAGCTGLTSVTIPNSVTSIGDLAFSYCTGLTSINVETNNPNYCSVEGVLFNKDKTRLIQYPGGKQGAYTIPNSVTSIGDLAFSYCIGLTSVTIGNSVTSIGDEAFAGCDGLTSITIPNSVTSIGNYAFSWCTSLTSVTIGNSVTSIGDYAFYECSGLTSITCEAITPPTLGSDVFSSVDTSIPLYVPAGSIDLYKAADQWKDFTNILPISQQGLEDVQGNNVQCTKIVHNGQIFILRGEKVYTLQGQEVK